MSSRTRIHRQPIWQETSSNRQRKHPAGEYITTSFSRSRYSRARDARPTGRSRYSRPKDARPTRQSRSRPHHSSPGRGSRSRYSSPRDARRSRWFPFRFWSRTRDSKDAGQTRGSRSRVLSQPPRSRETRCRDGSRTCSHQSRGHRPIRRSQSRSPPPPLYSLKLHAQVLIRQWQKEDAEQLHYYTALLGIFELDCIRKILTDVQK
ncbi:hypothetical protein M408DRAFT_129928 [Serendipita vermifera MAFF 305830]|uniref:Uncharacterized protein n=1 Tax=Serendipita vermifera MAFF 305830 TaxID=933852 RepID=A0A0C2W2A5_SERVB|nr:hypothetical protein M408DRAFT_129928 [Serendipita vermifera MAFF 305830]